MKRLFAVLVLLAMGVFLLPGATAAPEGVAEQPQEAEPSIAEKPAQAVPVVAEQPQEKKSKRPGPATVINLAVFSVIVAALVALAGKKPKCAGKEKTARMKTPF